MKIKLTLKAIIRWEQLRNKSFSLMNYSDKDDLETLLYTTTVCNDDKAYAIDVFRQTLSSEKVIKEMIFTLERESAVLAQFQRKKEVGTGDKDETHGLISDIISTLIISGMDAHYVLNEMELCDLPMFIEAYDRKKKEQMESARLWTFFSMLPHIDAKKMRNGAKDLITFPWEEEVTKRNAEQVMKENEENLKNFLSGNLFDINKVNWTKRE